MISCIKKLFSKQASKQPQDFLKPFNDMLKANGISLLDTEVTMLFTDGAALCGGKMGDYIACQSGIGSTLKIEFDRKYWDSLSDERRECLAYHELAHAILGLPHSSGIMSPALIDESDYVSNKQKYQKQLCDEWKRLFLRG